MPLNLTVQCQWTTAALQQCSRTTTHFVRYDHNHHGTTGMHACRTHLAAIVDYIAHANTNRNVTVYAHSARP